MSLLSELTLVVPTFQRPRYALRQMRYWSGSQVTIHILDGSSTPIDSAYFKDLEDNVHYHYMPISLISRFAQMPDLVNTPYAALLGDDEFFIPSALEKCIAELKKDEMLVACLGRCLYFRVVDQAIKGRLWIPGTSFNNYELSGDSARERVILHMNPYLPSTIYAVTKKDIWKKNIRAMGVAEYSSGNAYEIAYEIACAYQGKSKVIDTLMWLRSGENPPHPQMLIQEWYKSNNYKEEVEGFFNAIIKSLKSNEGPTEFEIRRILEDAVDTFLIDAVDTFLIMIAKPVEKKQVLYFIWPFIRRLFPDILLEKMRKRNELSMIEVAKKWKKQGVIVDLPELRRIQKILEEFHLA